MRQPNRKWTVPRQVLLERSEITWVNVARARKAIILKWGYDPAIKNAGSLTFRGCRSMALKEGHAATREHWTANALVT